MIKAAFAVANKRIRRIAVTMNGLANLIKYAVLSNRRLPTQAAPLELPIKHKRRIHLRKEVREINLGRSHRRDLERRHC